MQCVTSAYFEKKTDIAVLFEILICGTLSKMVLINCILINHLYIFMKILGIYHRDIIVDLYGLLDICVNFITYLCKFYYICPQTSGYS